MENKILNIVSSFLNKSSEEIKNILDKECVWDSLQKVEIIITIEEEFDVLFEQEEIAEIDTIAKLINKTKEKI